MTGSPAEWGMVLAVGMMAGGALALGARELVYRSRRRQGQASKDAEEDTRPRLSIALPASANGMVIEAIATDSTLADGTGIVGPRKVGGTGLVAADTTLVGFTKYGGGGAEPRLKAWHVGARGAVRAGHFGDNAPEEMRVWLDEWLALDREGRLKRIYDQTVRAQQEESTRSNEKEARSPGGRVRVRQTKAAPAVPRQSGQRRCRGTALRYAQKGRIVAGRKDKDRLPLKRYEPKGSEGVEQNEPLFKALRAGVLEARSDRYGAVLPEEEAELVQLLTARGQEGIRITNQGGPGGRGRSHRRRWRGRLVMDQLVEKGLARWVVKKNGVWTAMVTAAGQNRQSEDESVRRSPNPSRETPRVGENVRGLGWESGVGQDR